MRVVRINLFISLKNVFENEKVLKNVIYFQRTTMRLLFLSKRTVRHNFAP